MRYRRRYREALGAHERTIAGDSAGTTEARGTAHVDILCRCRHLRSDHDIVSAALAVCLNCDCTMFRAVKIVLTERV